jgi:hypothetical protein
MVDTSILLFVLKVELSITSDDIIEGERLLSSISVPKQIIEWPKSLCKYQ